MTKVSELIKGYQRFYTKHFLGEDKLYERLHAEGQSPKTLVIACSDSRVDPSLLLDANPGDIFVVRNVANLVPPYQPEWGSYHGTSAALEFAVNNLQVEHIIVLGHSGCAGIRALIREQDPSQFSFINGWVHIADSARARAMEKAHDQGACVHTLCEKEAIVTSLENLMTFPWVAEKVKAKKMTLHGWYFSLADGKLSALSTKGNFEGI